MSNTLANKIGNFLPKSIFNFFQPKYHLLREIFKLYKTGGKLGYDKEVGSWFASYPFSGSQMKISIRSYRELRRLIQFGEKQKDTIFSWLQNLKNVKCFYDIGSANGLEGFLFNHLYDSKVCFIEPGTPNIESIMKTTFLLGKSGSNINHIEIIHAGCDFESHYDKLYMLCPPKAGETHISFSEPSSYERRGRIYNNIVSQWIYGISIDDMWLKLNLEAPSHIKIDVDGFENRVMKGAKKTLKDKLVESWAIEITGEENMSYIQKLMKDNDYQEISRSEIYPGEKARTFDVIFEKIK